MKYLHVVPPPTDTMCYTCIYNYSNKLFKENKILLYVIVLYTMTTRYSHNVGEYECRICDKKYSRKYTLERHLVSIHGYLYKDYLEEYVKKHTDYLEDNNIDLTGNKEDNSNIADITEDINNNSTGNTEDIEISTTKTEVILVKKHLCNKCNKTFTRKWDLKKHKERCKGFIDKFSCQYCHTKFKHKDSRYRHYKTCKKKKEYDEKKKENESNIVINETTNSTIDEPCNDNKPKKGIVYFIQPHELVGTDRYKVGCSSNNSLERLKSYRKGTRIIAVLDSYNPFQLEKIIKSEFNNTFTLISGTEFFRGNESDMKRAFINIHEENS